MTANQFKQALDRLGLSQVRAAKAIGISFRSVNRYATGKQPIPAIVANMIKLMLDQPEPS
jgi:transcriptional regulator with XRE-family HTH domain